MIVVRSVLSSQLAFDCSNRPDNNRSCPFFVSSCCLSLIVWLGGLDLFPGGGADSFLRVAHAASGGTSRRPLAGDSALDGHRLRHRLSGQLAALLSRLSNGDSAAVRAAQCAHLPDAAAYADFAVRDHSADGHAHGRRSERSMLPLPTILPACSSMGCTTGLHESRAESCCSDWWLLT